MIEKQEKTLYSVSQLNRRAKQLLETHLHLVWVSGELSSLSRPSSGHWYFTLKDDRAQVRCAMFKSANGRLRWQVETGAQVMVRARVSLYEGRGDYQLIVEHMEEAGTGALQRAFEELKQKLQLEGLFEPSRKKALPAAPKHIGVITSPTGAAIQDILSVLKRRYPIAPVTILPVAVQGAQAAGELSLAVTKAENSQLFDLLIITRGGGSMEDLWPFNDETLARRIAQCEIPIISAVGHEIDFTIADFVADVRAPTPSASAEIATPDIIEWQMQLDKLQQDLQRNVDAIIRHKTNSVKALSQRLRHPKQTIDSQEQQCNSYRIRLEHAMLRMLQQLTAQRSHLQQRLEQASPSKIINEQQLRLQNQTKQLQAGIQQHISQKQYEVARYASILDAVSPLRVLSRGYAVVKDENDINITSSKQIKVGQTLTTQLNEGSFASEVTKTTPN